ncbi:MAG: peptide deformylase [Porphyromonadaceae bacterium]|nr:MAG: peptide deformylase [Porphyromonadaceae bacterium]
MILPVYAFGSPVLRKIAVEITPDHEGLSELVENMFETMKAADGVGLAAPQVGLPIRLFVLDARIYAEHEPSLADFKKVFINAHIVEKGGEEEIIEEGCLSIPNIHEDILRPGKIHIRYVNENFSPVDEWYEGMAARIIQHEYDHLDGIMFPDLVNPLRKTLLKSKLRDISKGKVAVKYKMVFPLKK